MTDPWHMLGPQGKSDRPVWLFAAGVAFVLLALAIGSALSYTSIVVAQATVSISPSTSLTLQGTNSDGTLTPDGSLTASLSLRVDNPSSRVLRLQLLAFSGWIEDGPATVGLNESRRLLDDRLLDGNSTRYFYRVFGESREVAGAIVGAANVAVFRFTYTLTHALNPNRFEVARNITDYWASASGNATAGPWIHWLRVHLVIEGVPVASSPTAAPHLMTIGTIGRMDGTNLAT